MNHRIEMDFGAFVLQATFFDTPIAQKILQHLPCRILLTRWGEELYGPIGVDLGEENPVADIPPGGIAYTRQGNYVCLFFGQRPAWAVEYIGRIADDQWKMLAADPDQVSVEIRLRL